MNLTLLQAMKTKVGNRLAIARRLVCLTSLVWLVASTGKLTAHEHVHTHASLSVGSLLFLDQAYPEDGALFSMSARVNIRNGSINEDDTPNFLFHFYDPKTGLNTHTGVSLQTAPTRAAVQFWPSAINQFRSGNVMSAFENLGHVLHLLQDMTSPAHVHNDPHVENPNPFSNCSDGDDFENWGWSDCEDHIFRSITNYITSTNVTAALRTNLTSGLQSIFGNQPVRVSLAGSGNTAYTYIHELATNVYTFTTFGVTLTDTFNPNDRGGGELTNMFPSLQETTVPAAWWIDQAGYSQGQCTGNAASFPQAWWMMTCTTEGDCGWNYCVAGDAYIENTGGGNNILGGISTAIPDNLIPAKYNRDWFKKRYGSANNSRSMLRIYGDVLYPAAVAYGAGLLQEFLDAAIMPKPVTRQVTVTDGDNVHAHGQAHSGGVNASIWFEWFTPGGPTNRTLPQGIGSGSSWVNVSAPIQGLLPQTTYYCRLVSSNQFGVRHGGTNQIFQTPAYVLANNGLNAWQIKDNSGASGSTLTYAKNLTGPQQSAATNLTGGWQYSVHARFGNDFADPESLSMIYGQGNKRFIIWFDLDSNGDLTARLEGGLTYTLSTNGTGAALYHTHEIIYNPTNGTARYVVDGVFKTNNWPGSASAYPAGQVAWGAGSSSGQGEMNFHTVTFQITGLGTVATYDAGTAGNPVEASNPTSQGWTRLAGTTTIPEGPLSPDGESFLVQAETLAASGLALQGAHLNGRVDPRGSPAAAWFEWGLNASYGNVAAIPSIPAAQGWTNVSALIGGLTQDTTYHYRLVASNSFGIRFGTNRTFTTPTYLLTGALPHAWQITDNDNSTTTGRTLRYTNTLSVPLRNSATTNGWRLTATSRLITDYSDTMTMTVSYVQGSTRFLFWLDFDNDGDLTVLLDGQSARKLTTSGVGATNYHTHEVQYANGAASYWFDGTLVVSNWVGIPATAPDYVGGQVSWGATSSAGRGQMNFHRIEFAIGGSNVVAAYNAGTTGNPVVSLNPTNQGWVLSAGAGPTTATVVPDAVPFQLIADAETLPASVVDPNTAQLNASVNPRGLPTEIWFDWGTTATYGNRTPIQNLGGSGATRFAQTISGLTVDTVYHYRVVASNAFVASYGSDLTFRTPWFQNSGIQLAAVDVGAVAWGDYDNDGDLDLIITGQTDTNHVTELYRNLGGTNLVAVNSGLPRVNGSAVAWGDYNNDGYLDVALSGWNPTGNVSRIYRNAQNGTFVDANVALPGLQWSSVTWSDYDNDGGLDLLLTGLDALTTNAVTRLYRNHGGTNFVDAGAGLPGVIQSSAAWSDFDGDGDQDLVLTGQDDSQTPLSRIYRNDGAGMLTDVGAGLPGVYAGSVAWGDYDGDGDPDLLLAGWNGGTYITHLFRNDLNGSQSTFVDVDANLPGISSSSVAWGDYDNDGDLDILMAGFTGNFDARVFCNDGAGVFEDIAAEFTGVAWASAAWADFDNDGDLDALITGSTSSNRICRIYRNGTMVPNVPPAAPTGLTGSGVGGIATISWNPAIDPTPASPLTYNVILSTTNGVNLNAPMSDAATGFRRVVRMGNAGDNLSATLTGLKPGTYQFSVQAIDSSFAGGPFAPWQIFQVAPYPVAIVDAQIPAPGQFRLHIIAGEGSTCEVLRSADLATWGAIGVATEVAPGLFEFLDVSAPVASTFYRVRSTAP